MYLITVKLKCRYVVGGFTYNEMILELVSVQPSHKKLYKED